MRSDRRILGPLLIIALTALIGASSCSAPPAQSLSGGTAYAATVQSDWEHTVQVLANLRADPPDLPVVYLLGGSVARECVPSEASWAAAVQGSGGPAALTFDLASSDRTTATDLKLVAEMPDTPTIVLIGINVGRFTRTPASPSISLPTPTGSLLPWTQHKYFTALGRDAKESLLRGWIRNRYPQFKQNFAYNLGMLEKLVRAARARGFHPVLLDLPRNTAVIGSRLDGPVGRYHRACKALAAEYGIPWVNFVGAARLKDGDFHDLWHLIKPGRAKWQALLAARTATLLQRYGMTASPAPSESPSP